MTMTTTTTTNFASLEDSAFLFDVFIGVMANAGDGRIGQRLRDACRDCGITARLVSNERVLVELILAVCLLNCHIVWVWGLVAGKLRYVAVARASDNDDQWQAALQRTSMPRALAALAGVVQRHAAAQRDTMSTTGLLAALHKMEGASTSTNKVGTLAENVLDALKTADQAVAAAVVQVRFVIVVVIVDIF